MDDSEYAIVNGTVAVKLLDGVAFHCDYKAQFAAIKRSGRVAEHATCAANHAAPIDPDSHRPSVRLGTETSCPSNTDENGVWNAQAQRIACAPPDSQYLFAPR